MPIAQEIPMLLVARSALNAARDGEKDVSGYSCLRCGQNVPSQ